jgi:two-component system, sensor histidine kinase ChiS
MDKQESKSKTILVVEDDFDIRQLYIEILNAEGFKVHAAASGEEALMILNKLERDPCLILTDFMMPGMSGADLIRIIQQEDLLLSLPVVIISAKPLGPELPQGVEFLKKPIDVDTIINKVKEYCGSAYLPCQKSRKEEGFRREDTLSI